MGGSTSNDEKGKNKEGREREGKTFFLGQLLTGISGRRGGHHYRKHFSR